MRILRKLFRIGEYNQSNYTKTNKKYIDQVLDHYRRLGLDNITMAVPRPPSGIFTTLHDSSVCYGYWDKNGYLCIYNTEGLNNAKL